MPPESGGGSPKGLTPQGGNQMYKLQWQAISLPHKRRLK